MVESHEVETSVNTGERFEIWLESIGKGTARHYRRYFTNFLEWVEMDTNTLYETTWDKLQSQIPIDRLWLWNKIQAYQRHMRDNLGFFIDVQDGRDVIRYATGTVEIVQKAIFAFFRCNGITDIPKNGKIPTYTKGTSRIEKEDLKEILTHTGSIKLRSVILFARDSGLRIGDITRLTVGQLREAIEDETRDFYTFTVIQQKLRHKRRTQADPTIGYETLIPLRKWMKYRTEQLGLSANDNDPLFCITKTKAGYTTGSGRTVRGSTAGDYMSDTNLGVLFSQLVKKAGLKETGISIHGLRSYHKTNLEYGGCPTDWVNKMQGRRGEGTQGTYTKPNENQIIEIYSKAYPHLSLESGPIPEEIHGLKAQVEELQKQLAEIKTEYEDKRNYYAVNLASEIEKAITKMGLRPMTEEEVKAELEYLKKESA